MGRPQKTLIPEAHMCVPMIPTNLVNVFNEEGQFCPPIDFLKTKTIGEAEALQMIYEEE